MVHHDRRSDEIRPQSYVATPEKKIPCDVRTKIDFFYLIQIYWHCTVFFKKSKLRYIQYVVCNAIQYTDTMMVPMQELYLIT